MAKKAAKEKAFGVRLREFREKAGMTQSQLGNILGCAPTRISEWEREVRRPKPLTQEGIFAVLSKHAE